MPRSTLLASMFVLLAATPVARAGVAQSQTMEITKLADGVYGAIYSEMKFDPVQANSLIVIGDDGVAVVDAHYTPSAARATIAEIRKLTPLPVRYLITTHWHDDHIFGNQEYEAAFPGIRIVAQQHARASMVAQALEHQQQLVKGYGTSIPKVEKAVATGIGSSGEKLSEADRAEYRVRLPIYRAFLEDVKTVRVVLPSITFDREITLYLGRREIRVYSFGAGNTRGDAVIFLPAERIAAVGDLVVYPVPYIYGGFPVAWLKSLDSVRALGPSILVPGHGPVMRDWSYVDQVSGLLASLAEQVAALVAKGLTVEQVRAQVDLKRWRERFATGHEAGEGTFDASIVRAGVQAAYDEAKALCEC